MSDKYMHASSTPSTTLQLPGNGKQEGRRKRAGLFRSLFQTLVPSRTEGKRSPLPVILAVLLWVGLAYAGYAFAVHTLDKQQQYVNSRIAAVQEENQLAMSEMEEQLILVQDEMKNVQDGLSNLEEDLQLTGETIGGTNKTKEALQDRIDQLNKQLVDLKASLKKLEDAARAW
jgi:septal ring factor EnvC (AmiA/AmiB activator)